MIRSKYFLLVLFFIFSSDLLFSQISTEITGIVRDSASQETLPNVSIYFKNTSNGTVTDLYGSFSLITKESGTLVISMVGYKEKVYKITANGKKRSLKVNLPMEYYGLDEIVVKPKRVRYSRKNNAAVDFVKAVIENKDKTRIQNQPYYNYDKYQKLSYFWNEFEEGKYGILNNKFAFLYDHIDTLSDATTILPLGLRENISTIYARTNPEKVHTIIHAQKQDGLDEFLPQEGVQKTLDEMFQEIDVYDNDIVLLSNHFVSPLSNIAPSFYKYYIIDSLVIDGEPCVNLGFTPFTTEAYGFSGSLFVTLDSFKYVKKAVFNVPKDINMNFVEDLHIELEYAMLDSSVRVKTRDFMTADFFVPALPRIYGERLNTYKNYSMDEPATDAIFERETPVTESAQSDSYTEEDWSNMRGEPLKSQESQVSTIMDEMHNVKAFRVVENVAKFCVDNYIPTKKVNSQFDYGPIFSTVTKNALEGWRIRVGGETTTAFDKHFFLDTYAAWGFKDKRPKGYGALEYSFNDKKQYRTEFPVHSLKASVKYDVAKVGEDFSGGTILSSLFSRSDDRNAIYQLNAALTYQRESYSGFSFTLDFVHQKSYSTELTQFYRYNKDNQLEKLDDYSMFTANIALRYAPGEKFYSSRRFRFSLSREKPVFVLSHNVGIKGFLGSEYTCNRTQLSFDKRFWLSYFGYMNLTLKGTKVWNRVPYPMLDVPNIGFSRLLDDKAFMLMDPVEFIHDWSVTWYISYFMGGLILNRIPIIRKLQFREVITFKGLYGGLSERNNVNKTSNKEGLFQVPYSTYSIENVPYMELSVGLDNILKIFRLDYVWRLTYRDHPNVSKGGLRFAFHLDF